MKRILNVTQTFHKKIIMDVTMEMSNKDIMDKINKYIKNNGGADTVIDQGGEIDFEITKLPVIPEVEDRYECID